MARTHVPWDAMSLDERMDAVGEGREAFLLMPRSRVPPAFNDYERIRVSRIKGRNGTTRRHDGFDSTVVGDGPTQRTYVGGHSTYGTWSSSGTSYRSRSWASRALN